jgi:hypothetical protein
VRGEGHEPDMRCGTVGTSGHATAKSSIHTWLCFINRALMHRRCDSLLREICGVSWHRTEGGVIPLTTSQKSAEGIVGPAQAKLVRHPRAERRGNG